MCDMFVCGCACIWLFLRHRLFVQLAVMQAVSIDWCMVLLILLYIHVFDIAFLFLVVPIISYKLSTVRAVNESSWEFIQGLVEAGLMSGGCDAIRFD